MRFHRTSLILALLLTLALLAQPTEAVSAAQTAKGTGEAAAATQGSTAAPTDSDTSADAADGTAGDSGQDGVTFASREPAHVKNITYTFPDVKGESFTWTFPYSDDFFRTDPEEFSITMARGSLGLALSAFRSDDMESRYRYYLSEAGFQDLLAFGYNKPASLHSLSGVIGRKTIGGKTVIAIVTCGYGYGKEWAGNLLVGKDVRHQGFEEASQKLQKHFKDYRDQYGIRRSPIVWLAGYSRAAAIANLTAADLIESGDCERVYAYLFGVPRTTREPKVYPGIYNLCGQYDPVPAAPLQSWGFEHYGTTLYTPAQEADADYPKLAIAANGTHSRLTSQRFHNNPEINYQLNLVLEFMGEFFPTADDYADHFQDILMDSWNAPTANHLAAILSEALMKMETDSLLQNKKRNTLINYLSYMAAQHVQLDRRQVADGYWNPDEPIAVNVALEHRPSTYVSWIFSHLSPETLLTRSIRSHRLTFIGDVSIKIRQKGIVIGSMSKTGKPGQAVVPEGMDASDLTAPFMVRNGRETLVSLPDDETYTITVSSSERDVLTYYDQQISPRKLLADPGLLYICTLNRGTYTLKLRPGRPLPPLIGPDGKALDTPSVEFRALPSDIMKNELDSLGFSCLTLGKALKLVAFVIALLLLVVIVSIIMLIVHRRKVRKGHPRYSDWYVIVPHLICVFTFAGLTVFATFQLYGIACVRAQMAAMSMLFLFFLSLRGTIRYRNKRNIALSAATLMLVAGFHQFYTGSVLDSHAFISMINFTVIILLLSILTVRSFRKAGAPTEAGTPGENRTAAPAR